MTTKVSSSERGKGNEVDERREKKGVHGEDWMEAVNHRRKARRIKRRSRMSSRMRRRKKKIPIKRKQKKETDQ